MKVTHGEPSMRVLESGPWLLGIALAAFILIFVGGRGWGPGLGAEFGGRAKWLCAAGAGDP